MTRYAAIDINFDSLGYAYGFPANYQDKTFFEVADRFLSLADKFGFKYSIYVIGKELEKAENQRAVRAWADGGHEIGNHTWSHPLNLGALPLERIRQEIGETHTILTETTGQTPVGFIAPGWSTSSKVLQVLIEFGYLYDTSIFPSWLMYSSFAKMLVLNFGSQRFKEILNRGDFAAHWMAPRRPYHTAGSLIRCTTQTRTGSILQMPLATNRYRMACWHTLGFVFGWKFHEQLVKSCLKELDTFYYLVHPADLIDPEDLEPGWKIYEERLRVPLKEKMLRMENAFAMILESGREIITMRELAAKTIASMTSPVETSAARK